MSDLKLALELYDMQTVSEACSAFCALTSIQLERYENHVRLLFTDCKYPIAITIAEFENYLIGLTCKKKQW